MWGLVLCRLYASPGLQMSHLSAESQVPLWGRESWVSLLLSSEKGWPSEMITRVRSKLESSVKAWDAYSLPFLFFLDHIQVKSLLNVLSVEEALFLQECSKHTSERTLDLNLSSVWYVMELSLLVVAYGDIWASITTFVPICVPIARKHLRPH